MHFKQPWAFLFLTESARNWRILHARRRKNRKKCSTRTRLTMWSDTSFLGRGGESVGGYWCVFARFLYPRQEESRTQRKRERMSRTPDALWQSLHSRDQSFRLRPRIQLIGRVPKIRIALESANAPSEKTGDKDRPQPELDESRPPLLSLSPTPVRGCSCSA